MSSASLTTIEVFLPDKDFDLYWELFSQQKRRNTEPPPTIDMARDSTSGYSGQSRRSSSYSTPQSTASRPRVSRGNSYTSPQSMPLGGGGGDPANLHGASSAYAGSNVTGYRRNLDVEGLPSSNYFSSGASKCDRRPEYVGQGSYAGSKAPSAISRRSNSYSTGGKELVKYTGPQEPVFEQPEAFDGDDDYGDEDDATVLPQDSISNVSSCRPERRRYNERVSSRRGSERGERILAVGSCRRAYSYGEGESVYGRGKMGSYAVDGGYQTVERRPRGY